MENRNAGRLARDDSLAVSQILIDDNVSPRPSEGLNSMRFSDLGDMTEEEWNKQQQRQNSQRYDKLSASDEGEAARVSGFGLQQKLLGQRGGGGVDHGSGSCSCVAGERFVSADSRRNRNCGDDSVGDGQSRCCCRERDGVWPSSASGETCMGYVLSMIYSLRNKNDIRNKQAQLTLWEMVKQFYLVNNLFFILKVLKTILSSNSKHRMNRDMSWVSFMCLLSTFMTSVLAYLTRSYIFYHRIEDKYLTKLFSPVHVYSQIRLVGSERPETLFMIERINWTYTLIMHILEDIPQLFASSIFLANCGNDFYAFFMITWSSCMIITTTIRMGVSYPLKNTLSLIFSRNPPVDSPVLNEATTTTIHFPLFIAAIAFIWAVFDSLCLYFTHGFWTILFYTGLVVNIFLSTLFILYYVHLSKQASARYSRRFNSLYFAEDLIRIQSRQS